MLSRTADNLYWLFRYVERAEYLARLIDASARLSALPSAYSGSSNEWESVLSAAGCADLFHRHHDIANRQTVIEFLAFSSDNPFSIRSCYEMARSNARAVRTALTIEMWEAINTAWLDLRKYRSRGMSEEELSGFLALVKATSLNFDGSAYRTMIRSDAYWFSRLGVMVERADNTARILDVKYHVLLPDNETIGGALDYFQWTTILRAVSAHTAFHWIYKDNVQPWLVADLLLLNPQLPRSIAACYTSIVRNLDALAAQYGRQGPAQRHARTMRTRLANSTIEQIFNTGLHETITELIVENNRLGTLVTEQYLT